MNSNSDTQAKKSPPPKRELKVLLGMRPGESWEEFKERAIEEVRKAGLLQEPESPK